MQIFVKGRRTIVFHVEETDTVLSLKEKIHDREGIPVAYLSLTYGGKVLEEAKMLADYGVRAEDTIRFNIRAS